MKVQITKQGSLEQSYQRNTAKTKFTGGFVGLSQGLSALNNNQAWGAVFVDLASMVIPRTTVDFTRGPDAGLETFRREASGTANHSLVGVYGFLAASALSGAMNKKFNLRCDKIFAGADTVNEFGRVWHNQIHDDKVSDKVGAFLEDVLSGIKDVDKDTQKEVVKVLKNEINNDGKAVLSKDSKKYLKTLLTTSTGTETSLVYDKGLKQKIIFTADEFLENTYSLVKAFKKDKVENIFKNTKNISENVFLKSITNLNRNKSLLGLGIAAAIGSCVQPLNMYLTKLKTGSDGFVGVEGREADKSGKFKLLKGAVAGLFTAGVIKTIGDGKVKNLVKNLQFQGLTPTMNQFKIVYGLTIASRFLAARDKNELREATIKDTLGFANWLILGNFVSKLVARGLDKSLVIPPSEKKGWFNWLTKSNIKTREEVLCTALKKAGISTVKDGKALSFKEMMSALPKATSKLTKSRIKYLNIAQLAGYVYSGLVLGFAIPKINIAITKATEKKKATNKAQDVLTPFNSANYQFIANTSKIKFASNK